MSGRTCPKCAHPKFLPVESHTSYSNRAQRIRRRCANCGHAWTVYEVTRDFMDYVRNLELRLSRAAALLTDDAPGQQTCNQCKQWSHERCSLDLPEAGGSFAADCAYFAPRQAR